MTCGDGSCGRSTWDFETGNLDGVYGLSQDPNVSEMLSVLTEQAHSGSHAAATRTLQGADFYYLDAFAPVCGGQGADLTERTVGAWVLSPESAYLCLIENCIVVQASQWTYIETTAQGISTSIRIEIMGGGTWNGRVYIDDITIQP
jgi:hypothetical protein